MSHTKGLVESWPVNWTTMIAVSAEFRRVVGDGNVDLAASIAAQIAFTLAKRDRDELLVAVRDLLDGCLSTDSYCESCRRHAPKNDTGHVVGPIQHARDCIEGNARSLLARMEKKA